MLKKGDRVYDKAINANGYVIGASMAGVTVQYFWGMHSKYEMNWAERSRRRWHKATPDKQRLVTDLDQLVVADAPTSAKNHVSMFGGRILNRRIRLIAELDRYRYGDTSDIVIRYGTRPEGWQTNAKLIINHNLTINKYDQCIKLRELAPESTDVMPNDTHGWILKPHYSVGGRGIEDYHGQHPDGRYFQKKIKKTREFRAHVFLFAKDKCPLIQEKMIDDRSQLCWNMKKGGRFYYVWEPAIDRKSIDSELAEAIKDISVRALKRLKYDMGGVDLCMDEDGKLWILEVNSYWGQREMTLAATKMAFWDLLNLDIDEYVATRWEEEEEEEIWDILDDISAMNDHEPGTEIDREPIGILSQLEDKVTDEERAAMLEAGRKVKFPAMLADSEVQYASR